MGLAAAAAEDPSLYQWSPVPQGEAAVRQYVDTALAWRDAGTAVPFAIVRAADGEAVGCSRFFNLERWNWPASHALHGHETPDACEIGYTWLARSAIRTAANTEAKLLMLRHAFEAWRVLRVCLHTDVRNQRSRAAIERMEENSRGCCGRIAWRPIGFRAIRPAFPSCAQNGRRCSGGWQAFWSAARRVKIMQNS